MSLAVRFRKGGSADGRPKEQQQQQPTLAGTQVHKDVKKVRRQRKPIPYVAKILFLCTPIVVWIHFLDLREAKETLLELLPPINFYIEHTVHPRTLSYIQDETTGMFSFARLLEENFIPPRGNYSVQVSLMGSRSRGEAILNSKDYESLDELEAEKNSSCQLRYDWQKTSFPACNNVHEFDIASPSTDAGNAKYNYLTHGFYRDVYSAVDDIGKDFVYKPMRMKHDYVYRNFDRMRRDTLVMERLTAHKYILNIYSACGTSGFFEYADGGDVESAIWPDNEDNDKVAKLTPMQKLHIATQASMGLAGVHNIDKEGVATVAHTDISPGQFIKVNGFYKLNDFNRARFIRFDQEGTACYFYVGNNAGKNRAPEEYAYKGETEKVDIYSFGNILYMLLQGEWPFEDNSTDTAQKSVIDGIRPPVYEDLWNSRDPVEMALKEMMMMCHAQEPNDRPTARQLEAYFKNKLRELDPYRLEEWGDA